MATLLTNLKNLDYSDGVIFAGGDAVTVKKLNYSDNKGQNGLTIGIYDLGGSVYAFASESPDILNLKSDSFSTSPSVVKLMASGTFDTDSNGDAVAISLNLTKEYSSSNAKLLFYNNNIKSITDSTQDDVIYIISDGVNSEATLNFSQGKDTIKFNGATTVQNISGGGVRREYAYSSA